MERVVRLRALAAAPLVAVLCCAISAAGAGAAGPTGTRIVAPKPLIPKGAKQLGAVSPSATLSGAIVLRPRDESALTSFISQVTDKHSPLFHHYLTPGTFAARFGATPSSIAAVESQLRSAGLTVTDVAPDGLIVGFTAPASRVESEFQTGLERYKLANGSFRHARTAPLKVPATIARYVTSVVGLDTTVQLRPLGIPRASESTDGTYPAAKAPSFTHPPGSPTACADASSAAQDFGGLTDDQIANAYGVFGLYGAGDTGVGQHIAVYELEPFATSDLQTFDTCYFGATRAAAMLGRLHTINVDGGPGSGPGSGESILDVQDVSAFAPGANIDVYQAPNTTFGSLDEYARIVNDDVDQIVSTSWGFCEQGLEEGSPGVQQAENVIFEQAAAQGQTVFSAAGDEGSDDCNSFGTTSPVSPILSVNDPSSQPYVVAAGGTTIDDATQPASEHVWNDGPVGGAAGGGISESWPMPAWQINSLVPGGAGALSNSGAVTAAESFMGTDFCLSDTSGGSLEPACRQLPDVSADADEFTGGITIFSDAFGGWLTIGGTSSAAPMWAGMLADVNASATCKSNPATANGVGFVSPLLYAVASNPTAYAASFNDITVGNNDPFGDSNLFQATTGYDMGSGLGTPQLTQPGGKAGLAFYLCNQAPAATRPTVTSVSPGFELSSEAGKTVTITGTNFESNGVSKVGSLQVGDFTIPPSPALTVLSPTEIVAKLPPASDVIPPKETTDGAGRVQVIVTLTDGESSAATANSWFTFVDDNGSSQALPTVTSVHSYTGADAGGNTVDIYGAGFTGATGVTFGGVSAGAGNFTVNADGTQISVTVPAFQNGLTSCVHDGSEFDASENAANDICQTQVEVTTPDGTSKNSTILPLYEGAVSFDDNGVIPLPAGDEAAPAATEYDYVPTPAITSISTAGGPGSLASEEGGSVVTIHGKGLNLAALDWVNFGASTLASSQQEIFNIVSETGTELQIEAPAFASLTVGPANVPVSVMSAAGLSNQVNATYAGIPTVSSVAATSGPTAGQPAGPDTGGTPIEIHGSGFANQATLVTFNDIATPFSVGTQFNLTVASDTKLTTKTVAQNPAVVDTQVCTVTDCSSPSSLAGDTADLFILFPPGNPKIDSITPSSGPATGGTAVTITGENLGCVTNVSFGGVAALNLTNAEALLDCGSTNTVTVTAPPGRVATVPVTLDTVESEASAGVPAAVGSFTYTQPPAQTLTVHRSGNGAGKVTSTPSGISCSQKTCSHAFTFGSLVTLKAKAARGSGFAGWSGACTGRSACKLTANEVLAVTARFALANCVVPKVTGKTLAAAKRALAAHFCSAGTVEQVSSTTLRKGRVASQKPKPGTHLRHGGKVSLTVSKGP